jgi:uncharacterized membrane protein
VSNNAEHDSSLEQRVQGLESAVTELQRLVRQLQSTLLDHEPNVLDHDLPLPDLRPSAPETPISPASTAAPPRTVSPAPAEKPSAIFDRAQSWEFWLNRIGIGLLLLGVGFLFKFSIDQGWLTPAVRVWFGLALGAGFLVTGQRLLNFRRAFSQILSGGGIALWYLSGFAAFQLFHLVSFGVAFGGMLAVTGLAFFLSVRQSQAVLSVLGAVGGLGTPFLLYTPGGSLVGLVGYTSLILLGTAAIYFWQGWRSLFWTTFVGSWLILLLSLWEAGSGIERWAVQGGILWSGLLFAGLPLLRLVGGRIPRPLPGRIAAPDATVGLITVFVPLLVFFFSRQLWSLPDSTWGGVLVLAAVVYGGLGYGLRRFWPSLAEIEILVCLLLVAIALVMLFSGNLLFVMLALQAVVLHFLAVRLGDRKILVVAHVQSTAIALRLYDRLLTHAATSPVVFNPPALTDLAVIVILIGLGVYLLPAPGPIYLGVAHIAVLIWVTWQFSEISSGYVTIIWGLIAIALLVFGLRRDQLLLRMAGLGTLALVILKLFFYDLVGLESIWRILLFMGFGAGLLLLSYFSRSLWKPQPSALPSPEPESESDSESSEPP